MVVRAPRLLEYRDLKHTSIHILFLGENSEVWDNQTFHLLHFVAFFHVALLLSTGALGVDNKKVGVDNEKALELDNRIFFFIFQPDFNLEISPKNATKYPVA